MRTPFIQVAATWKVGATWIKGTPGQTRIRRKRIGVIRALLRESGLLEGAMETETTGELACINHPKRQTLLRCSSCERPICVKCMRQSSVGAKCPDCARVPSRAKHLARPIHYIKGALAGVLTAAFLAALLTRLSIGFFGLLAPAAAGFVVGTVVVKAASNQRHFGIQVTAGLAAAAGFIAGTLAAGVPALVAVGGASLFRTGLAAMVAAFVVSR